MLLNRTSGLRIKSRETISLCMIVRDEAEELRRCLNSVKDLVNEIIVVDTGSSDRVVKAAESFRAKVLHFKWIDDFSAARNASIEIAASDWILTLDCDEVISPKDHAQIQQCLKASKAYSGLRMTTRNYSHQINTAGWTRCCGDYQEEIDYSGWFPSTKVRLFRRNAHIRFEGTVHELVEDTILRVGGKIGDCHVPVHHYGYTDTVAAGEKYLFANQNKLKEKPDDIRALFELATAYCNSKQLYEAKATINQVLEAMTKLDPKTLGEKYIVPRLVYQQQGLILERSGELDAAIDAYHRALVEDSKAFEVLNNLGVVHEKKGDFLKATSLYTQALTLQPDSPLIQKNLRRAHNKLET